MKGRGKEGPWLGVSGRAEGAVVPSLIPAAEHQQGAQLCTMCRRDDRNTEGKGNVMSERLPVPRVLELTSSDHELQEHF